MVVGESAACVADLLGVDHREVDAVLADLKRLLAALTARIYADNGKEERVLYPMTDRLAREEGTLDDLMGRLREFWS